MSLPVCFEFLNSANFCFETRGFVSVFVISDNEVSFSGFSSLKVGILEWFTGKATYKGILESSICF